MTDILAFPQGNEWMDAEGNMRLIHEGGMTLRDYFAAAALQGICASQFIADHAPKGEASAIAKRAGEIADAMIAERSKRDA
jgi:hypothetical protein